MQQVVVLAKGFFVNAKEAADWWTGLAKEQDAWADYEEGRGRYGGVYRRRAKNYRDAAKALALEAATGIPHCNICFGPHPNYLHKNG